MIKKFLNPAGPITKYYNPNVNSSNYSGSITNYYQNKGGFGGGRTGGGGASNDLPWDYPKYEVEKDTIWIPIKQTFNDAFKNARDKGLKEFEFNGEIYNTNLGDNPNNWKVGQLRTREYLIPIEKGRKRKLVNKNKFGGILFAKNGTLFEEIASKIWGNSYTEGDKNTKEKYKLAYKKNKKNLDKLYNLIKEDEEINKTEEYNEVFNNPTYTLQLENININKLDTTEEDIINIEDKIKQNNNITDKIPVIRKFNKLKLIKKKTSTPTKTLLQIVLEKYPTMDWKEGDVKDFNNLKDFEDTLLTGPYWKTSNNSERNYIIERNKQIWKNNGRTTIYVSPDGSYILNSSDGTCTILTPKTINNKKYYTWKHKGIEYGYDPETKKTYRLKLVKKVIKVPKSKPTPSVSNRSKNTKPTLNDNVTNKVNKNDDWLNNVTVNETGDWFSNL